jgi:hypothetical protein
MPNEAVIIAGALDSKELERSIDAIINTISSKSEHMADPFTNAIGKMEQAMKNFAITQKVSASTMKDAWREMSASFDAMFAAQSASNGGGNGSGNAEEGTIGALKSQISELGKKLNLEKLNTQELRDQVGALKEAKNLLKEQTTSVPSKVVNAAIKSQVSSLQDAKDKLSTLETLQSRYAGTTKLSVQEQDRLSRAIAQTKKQIEQMQAKAPKTIKEVLGMDANSIDQIAAKMRALKNVQIDPKNAAEVKNVSDAYAKLKREQAQLMGQNIQHTHSNNLLAQSFGYIRNRIVYALTLGAITSFTKQIYEIRGQYELLERSLGVLVNSFERGSQIFNELNEMAIKSPFTLIELGTAAKQLTAYNFAANEVVDTTRRIADISAALGVPMERLTYNLGQIRAQTVLTARDARDFANAGLPIVASLADHFTELEGKVVTTGDVYDRMSKKMVSYSDVMAVLNKMTDEGGKFFDFQAKQAGTLRVQMANLNLAWNNMLNDMGKANQEGLISLTTPVKILKSMLQNWQSIDRVLKSMIVTFGLWKALQVVAIRNQWDWARSTGATAKQMGFLTNATKGLFASTKALFLNPWTWVFVGIQAIVDLTHQFLNARSAMHELNQEIRDNANEASESMLNYLNNKGNKSTFELAKQNKLTAEQGDKAWEGLKQQIEQSALSANDLIAELLAIEDVNKRVRVGFDYAERIQKAQAALQDLKEDSIKVNQDYTFLGIGEEGLASDLQDYANYIEKYSQIAKENNLAGEEANKWIQSVEVVKGARQEFLKELDDTAESINNFIRAYNITDPLQIKEILERVRSQIKAKNPEIKGEMAKIFDISLDQKMAELTNGAVDRNASLWNMFMERLKNNSSSAFQDINDDWIKSNKSLSKEQKAAIDANLKYFKDSMPYAYDAVANMVKDASKLRIHIGITFGNDKSTPFQKEVQKRMAQHPILDYGNFAPTANDDLNSWVKTQQEAIKKLKEENKLYARDNSKWSKQKIKDNNSEIEQRKNNLDLFHQQYLSEKDADAARRKADAERRKREKAYKKDVNDIASAIKDEISLINDMRNNYEKLRNAGVSSFDAIDISTRGYSNTILRLNNIFKKFGIKEFNAKDFAGKDIHGLLNALTKQRNDILASGKVKTQSIKDLDVEIQKLQIEAKTYDMKKITDGLNNELGKLKDEYELAIELDANPEVGGMIADFMGVDVKELPRTFEEAAKMAQASIDKIFKENGRNNKIDIVSMLNKGNFDKWVKDSKLSMESELVKAIENFRQYLHKAEVDENKKLLQNWQKLLEKYSAYEYQRSNIAKNATKERIDLVNKLGSQDQKNAVAKIKTEIDAAKDPKEKERLQQELDNVISDVTKNNEQAATIAISITNKEKQETSKLDFEEFKNSDDWIAAMGDTANLTTATMQRLIETLQNLIATNSNLDATQIKEINNAIEKMQKDIIERNPFSALASSIDNVKKKREALAKAREELKHAKIAEGVAKLTGNYYKQAKAQSQVKEKGEKVKQAERELGNAQKDLSENVKSTISEFGSMYDSMSNLRNMLGETADQAIQAGISIATSITSVYKKIDKVEKTVAILAIIKAALAAINFLAGIFGGKKDTYTPLKEQIDRLADIMNKVAEAQLEALGKMTGPRAIKKYQEIKEQNDTIIQSYRDLALEAGRSGSSIGSHSYAYRTNKRLADSWEKISKLAGKSITQVQDLYNLEPKKLKAIMEGAPVEWSKITTEIRESLEKVIEYGVDKANEYADALKEALTSISLDDLTSDFEDMLKDMDNDSKNFAENFEEYMRNAIIRTMMTNTYNKALEDWYKDFQEKISDNSLSKDDVNDLREDYMRIVNQALNDRDRLLSVVGNSKNGELSSLQQGIQGITEDQAGALESYMNIVSQKVYEQNSLLVDIREHISNFNMDVQLGTLSQMLLQLQQSYQVHKNIEAILNGVLNPSGRAIVVELNS